MQDHNLKKKQVSNLKTVCKAVKDFSDYARIDLSQPAINNKTIVLESGHQPNFLPYSGFWKKLFLLDLLNKKYQAQGEKTIALFGFLDNNLCTSRFLTQNMLPDLNRIGYKRVGFKISGDNVWKRFDYLDVPEENVWKKEIENIVSHYNKYSRFQNMELDPGVLIDILEEGYRYADNFADINSYFIANVSSRLFGFDICFFRYSDLQKKKLFLEEWKEIISRLDEYDNIYNTSIKEHGLELPLVEPDSLPFWYHCPCGAKVHLSLSGDMGSGTCKLCSRKNTVDLNKLGEVFNNMSLNAVARNVVFSEGLGTYKFISGQGGSLKYGRISVEILRRFGFNLPDTISWKSRDYYTGPVHRAALRELGKICKVTEEDIRKDIDKVIADKNTRLTEKAIKERDKGNRENARKYEEQYRTFGNTVSILKKVYDTSPSFMDILVSQGVEKVKKHWENALKEIGDEQTIEKNIYYSKENIIEIN